MYNIITCQPVAPRLTPISRPPRLGNPRPDPFSTQKNTAQNILSLPPSSHPIPISQNPSQHPSLSSYPHLTPSSNPSSLRSLMGASGYDYNFISFTEKESRETLKSLRDQDKFVTLKKKGVGEFADLGRLMNPNMNQEFQDNYKSKPDMFRRVKGMCSTLCDTEKGYGRKQFRKFKY